MTEAEQQRFAIPQYAGDEVPGDRDGTSRDRGGGAGGEVGVREEDGLRGSGDSFSMPSPPQVPSAISSPQAHALMGQLRSENAALKVRHARMLGHIISSLRAVCLEAAEFSAAGGARAALMRADRDL